MGVLYRVSHVHVQYLDSADKAIASGLFLDTKSLKLSKSFSCKQDHISTAQAHIHCTLFYFAHPLK